MVEYEEVVERSADLVLGLSGPHVDFDWRPFDRRRADQQEDYLRLRASIGRVGIRRPVITWHKHVLIGMRRVEIARDLGIATVRAFRILEDVTKWRGRDLERLEWLKRRCGETPY